MTSDKQILEQALACLEESYSYVEEDAENAERMYGKYPTRQARIQGLKDEARKHWDAITAIRARLEQPEQKPVATIDSLEQEIYENTQEFVSLNVMEWLLKRLNTTPPNVATPLAAQPAPEQYTAMEQALTRLQKRYGELELKVATQRQWVGLDWLPEHKCGLHLSHNEHRDVYETIEQFYDAEDFISPDEWQKALAEDSVWVLHWYPETPIGFHCIAASTLEAIETKLKEKNA